MLHRKLLLRRWACVPWLLAVGLVLGWSGEAVANGAHGDNPHDNHRQIITTLRREGHTACHRSLFALYLMS